MRRARASSLAAIAIAIAASAAMLAGCGTSAAPPSAVTAPSAAPTRIVTGTVLQTRGALVTALGAENLVLTDSQAAVRPAEAPALAGAPRAVYQVILPKDPSKGFVIVYEFVDPAHAAGAAAEQQAYLATGPGRVQTPQGTVSVIRQVGSTVVYYQWLPAAAQDPSAAGIEDALDGLGIGFPVPN
jgi:hypothetical protein